MDCRFISHLLPGTHLLPDRLAQWVRTRWLEPHADRCAECRTFLRRVEQLDLRMQELSAAEALVLVSRPMERHGRVWSWRRGPALAGAVALSAGVLALALPALVPRRLAGTHPGTTTAQPNLRPTVMHAPVRRPENRNPNTHPLLQASIGPASGTKPVRGEPAPRASLATPVADLDYLNGEATVRAGLWVTRAPSQDLRGLLTQKLPPMRDDFVRPRPALLAANGEAALRLAAEEQRREAAVVDTRLFRKVTLALKGTSLEELCAALKQQTGVSFSASRGVADEKVTVLLEDRPARDVMRAAARLFGYLWERQGVSGSYKYFLVQSLRARLAEEEMRNQDLNSALLSLDEQMEADRPLAELTLEQIREQLKTAKGAQAQHLRALAQGGIGGLMVYQRLTPAERLELRSTGRLSFTMDHPNPARRLPAEWRSMLLDSCRLDLLQEDGTYAADADRPGAQPVVALSLDRSEAGQLALHCDTFAIIPGQGGTSLPQVLATGKCASTEKPENARVNAALKNRPELQERVTLEPTPSCLYLGDRQRSDVHELMMTTGNRYLGVLPQLPLPHLTSADVWEEVHRQTRLPIVADFYSRIYPADPFKARSITAFDALCRTGDNLGALWRLDGGMVLARRTAFFWDKLKEVPKVTLDRWADDRRNRGALPLEDLVEMASLSQPQLDSTPVGEVIRHCWGLEDWSIVGGGDENSTNGWRARVHALGALTAGQLQAAQRPEGLELRLLTPQQLQALVATSGELSAVKEFTGARFRVDYAPSGWYVWQPVVSRVAAGPLVERILAAPMVAAPTREAALEGGRKLLPTSQPGDVRRSTGLVAFTVTFPDSHRITEGRPSALVQATGP